MSGLATDKCVELAGEFGDEWREKVAKSIEDPVYLACEVTLELLAKVCLVFKDERRLLGKDMEFLDLLASKTSNGCLLIALRIPPLPKSLPYIPNLVDFLITLVETNPTTWKTHVSQPWHLPLIWSTTEKVDPVPAPRLVLQPSLRPQILLSR